MATRTLMTAAEFDQLPVDGRRRDLLDGEMVEMPSATPEHNLVLLAMACSLEAFLTRRELGRVLMTTEFLVGECCRLQPDVAFLRTDRWAQLDRRSVPVTVGLDVAVEVVSPSESAHDLERKVRLYLQAGATEVWLVYPEFQCVYVHAASDVRRLDSDATLTCPLLPGWSLPLATLFGA